jgi:hypothetical protein
MHAPDSQSQRECAAASPENAAAAMSYANTLRDLYRDVGAQGGDYDREKDKAQAVRLLDHERRANRLKKELAIMFGLLLDFSRTQFGLPVRRKMQAPLFLFIQMSVSHWIRCA